MRLATPLTVAGVLLATVAGAAPRRASSRPGPDLYAGYSYTHAGQARLNGWALAGTHPLRGDLRVVAELTGHYGSFAGADFGQTALMAGVRQMWTWRRAQPFLDGLAGFARASTTFGEISDSRMNWGLALGGGVDYPLADRWAARGLVHLRLLHGNGTWDSDPRLSLGAVYRFDRR